MGSRRRKDRVRLSYSGDRAQPWSGGSCKAVDGWEGGQLRQRDREPCEERGRGSVCALVCVCARLGRVYGQVGRHKRPCEGVKRDQGGLGRL